MAGFKRIKQRLAYKLFLAIFLFSGLIIGVITAVQLYVEYRRDLKALNARFIQIEKSFGKSLGSALWRYNTELLQAQLEGIHQLQDIEYVAVSEGERTVISIGKPQYLADLTRVYPLSYSYQGRTRKLGTLTVSADYSGIYSRLYERLIIILFSSAIKTLSICLFMLILFQMMVMRHLEAIADYFQSYSLSDPGKPLRLDIRRADPEEGDELHRIEAAINQLIDFIRGSYERAQEMVAQRTKAISRSQRRFQAIFHAAPIGMALIDSDLRLIMVNPRIVEMSGYSKEAMAGLSFADLTHPEDRAREKALYEQLFSEGMEHFSLEKRNIAKDGRVCWVSLHVAAIGNAGHRSELAVAMIQDISEIKKAEAELKRSNRELEQFAYVASHDLQEPLRAIVGFLSLLQNRFGADLDAKGHHYIDRAVKAGQRMQHMIEDLLALSRVNTRGADFAPVDLNTVMEGALDNLQSRIEAQAAAITCAPLPTLAVDANQIQSLFQNLLSNALKYNNSQPPTIAIGCQDQDESYRFFVKDNGIGLDPRFSERIFQVFQRLHTTREYSGSGLGLALAKKIVERHGGSIWVASEPSQGSIFYFTLKKA